MWSLICSELITQWTVAAAVTKFSHTTLPQLAAGLQSACVPQLPTLNLFYPHFDWQRTIWCHRASSERMRMIQIHGKSKQIGGLETSNIRTHHTTYGRYPTAFRPRGTQQFWLGTEQKIRTEENSHVIAAKTVEKTRTTICEERRARCGGRGPRGAGRRRRLAAAGAERHAPRRPRARRRASVRQTAERAGPPAPRASLGHASVIEPQHPRRTAASALWH